MNVNNFTSSYNSVFSYSDASTDSGMLPTSHIGKHTHISIMDTTNPPPSKKKKRNSSPSVCSDESKFCIFHPVSFWSTLLYPLSYCCMSPLVEVFILNFLSDSVLSFLYHSNSRKVPLCD